MMVSLGGTRIVVATRAVDFRKGHDGLAAVVQNELGLDPYSGVAYVFRAKRTDRIKVLWWDGTGLVMAYKRLEQGQFAWPAVRNGVIRLTRAQFEAPVRGSGLAPGVVSEGAQTEDCGLTPETAIESLDRPALRPIFVYNLLIL